MGAVATALTHYTQGIALYDAHQHRAAALLYGDDAGVVCYIHAARALWYLGYPAQGLARSQEAVTLARQSAHPFSLSVALSGAAWFHQIRREGSAAQECAEASIHLAMEQGFPLYTARGAVLHGWALVHQRQAAEGLRQIQQGMAALRALGTEIVLSPYLALFAEAYEIIGQSTEGLRVLDEALTQVHQTEERYYEAELHRLRGALLLQQSLDHQAEAEVCFHTALEIARSQQAKSFELRTATSLARLWQQHGKRQEAHDLLAPVYHWFTEGFDTADLQEAKALLDALA
jgi:predicted ATPase